MTADSAFRFAALAGAVFQFAGFFHVSLRGVGFGSGEVSQEMYWARLAGVFSSSYFAIQAK